MNTIGIIAVGIMILVLVVFLITINNWDKKIEKGESLQQSKKGDAIAKFFLYLFVVAFIVFNIVVMKDCSRGSNIPFEETIRRN
jgi:cytochrome b561